MVIGLEERDGWGVGGPEKLLPRVGWVKRGVVGTLEVGRRGKGLVGLVEWGLQGE